MDDTTSRPPIVPESFNQSLFQIPNTPQRGGCLTIYLFFSTFAIIPGIIGLYLLFRSLPAFSDQLSQFDIIRYNNFYLTIGIYIFYAIGLIGTWKWKKWGILLMAIANGTIATNIIYGNETMIPAFQTFGSLIISFSVLFAVVKDNWKDFK